MAIQFVRNDQIIPALLANGYITTGANIAPRKPKVCTISIEEANECTDNYSKKLCTNENPYYYIETDEFNAQDRYSVPTLDKYDRKTGKPIIQRYEQLEYEWAMDRCCGTR
jgi:hypothetical protein